MSELEQEGEKSNDERGTRNDESENDESEVSLDSLLITHQSSLSASFSIEAALECLLFVAGEPVTTADLGRGLEQDEIAVEAGLRSLQVTLTERGSGLQLIRIAGGWQLATRPEYALNVARMLARGSSKLSRAAMETLAIIAYRQPITAPEIEAVRGVSTSGVLKTLAERRLIAEAGRKAALGRPMLYVTTPDFLHYFAISDLSQLPPLEADMPAPAGVSADMVTHGRPASESLPPLVLDPPTEPNNL